MVKNLCTCARGMVSTRAGASARRRGVSWPVEVVCTWLDEGAEAIGEIARQDHLSHYEWC